MHLAGFLTGPRAQVVQAVDLAGHQVAGGADVARAADRQNREAQQLDAGVDQ